MSSNQIEIPLKDYQADYDQDLIITLYIMQLEGSNWVFDLSKLVSSEWYCITNCKKIDCIHVIIHIHPMSTDTQTNALD